MITLAQHTHTQPSRRTNTHTHIVHIHGDKRCPVLHDIILREPSDSAAAVVAVTLYLTDYWVLGGHHSLEARPLRASTESVLIARPVLNRPSKLLLK